MKIKINDRISKTGGRGLILLIFRTSFFRIATGGPGDWLWKTRSENDTEYTFLLSAMKVEGPIGRGYEVCVGPLMFMYYGLKDHK